MLQAVSSWMPRNSPRPLQGALVLVVDEHPESARLLRAVLEPAGAEVIFADTAEKAISLVAERRPEVVVLELVLGGHTGLALLRALRAPSAPQRTVCIVLTATNGGDTEREALRAGAAAFVRKPVDTETFAALVADALEKNR